MKKIFIFVVVFIALFTFNLKAYAFEGFRITDDIITISSDTPYQINYEGNITGLRFTVSNTFGVPVGEEAVSVSETGLVTMQNDGVAILSVSCISDTNYNCMRYVSKINDKITVLADKTGVYTSVFSDITDEFNARKLQLEEDMDELDTTAVTVNFIRNLMSLTFDTTDDDGNVNGQITNYGEDYISFFLPEYGVTEVELKYNFVEDTLEIMGVATTFQVGFGDGNYATISGPASEKKIVNINYATGNETDSNSVANAAQLIPVNNKSYINTSVTETFTVEDIVARQFTNSDAANLLDSLGIDYYFDARYGDSSPLSPFVGGQIVLGKNDVYYTAQEFKIWSTLRLPRNDSMTLIENITNYFENNLDGDYEIRVEEDEENPGVYRTYMTDNNEFTFLDKILDFFAPRVYAGEEGSVITFSVEEVDAISSNINNPQTSVPNLTIYVILAVISAVSLGFFLKKKKTNN